MPFRIIIFLGINNYVLYQLILLRTYINPKGKKYIHTLTFD